RVRDRRRGRGEVPAHPRDRPEHRRPRLRPRFCGPHGLSQRPAYAGHTMPLRIRDYGETHLKTDDDLFYFLQCATVASPKEPGWTDRAAEEEYALDRFVEYLRYLEKNEWFAIRRTSASTTGGTGQVRHRGRSWYSE